MEPLSHRYVDLNQQVEALRRLADAIENGEARVQGIEKSESIAVDSEARESITFEYSLTEAFHGVEPLLYDNGYPGGPEAMEGE